MKNKSLLIAIAFLTAGLIGCSKDGATGATGPTGPTGPTGTAGTNGTNGVANIHDTIYTITPGLWQSSGNDFVIVFNNPYITNFNTDEVDAYSNGSSTANWIALPAFNIFATGDEESFGYNNGTFTFIYAGASSAPSKTYYVKVVVIPPSVMNQHPNTNWHDYRQVLAIIDAEKSNKN